MKTTVPYVKVLLLLVAICSTTLITKAQTSAFPADSLTLITFQRELMQKGWPALWDTAQWVYNWEGVDIDNSTGKVSKILVYGDELTPEYTTDSIPYCIKTLGALDSLKELTFGLLGIKYISDELWEFDQLETLGLNHNSLENIPNGINELTKLKYLFLGSNNLTDLPVMNNLTELIFLSLSVNYDLTSLPISVFSLHNLQTLSVHYCNIQSIPDLFDSLPNLEKFKINANQINSLPSSIGKAIALEQLYLSYNNLLELPESIGDLPLLHYLDFDNNLLDSFPVAIANAPNLYYIKGRNNLMKGGIPSSLFDANSLKLYLDNNQLSGDLEIVSGSVPEYLGIANNNYTFKELVPIYDLFDGTNHVIDINPQNEIGETLSFYPTNNSLFTLSIPNYTPATNCQFQWYKRSSLAGSYVAYSNQEELTWNSFDSGSDGGFYYCVVTHNSISELSLESYVLRVIGENSAPSVSVGNISFRNSKTATLTVSASDDFSVNDSLTVSWLSETNHLILTEKTNQFQCSVEAKDISWTGTDTVSVSVLDEHGNSASGYGLVTVLSAVNTPPEINRDTIYMNSVNDYVPPCTPNTPGCSSFYIFESHTYFQNFISDDRTNTEYLSYEILEADSATGSINGNPWINMKIVNEPLIDGDGGLEALAYYIYQDTIIQVSLKVTDAEGGTTTQPLTFIAMGSVPNENPVVSDGLIGEQLILKGTESFDTLNLNDYVSDDYISNEDLEWEYLGNVNFSVTLNDNIALVTPVYPDSCYTGSITYKVYEATNDYRSSSVDITYTITNATYAVIFTVSNGNTDIANATITIDGNAYITDATGQASISGLIDGIYNYEVTASGYATLYGTITVNGSDVSESVNMSIITAEYTVTFTDWDNTILSTQTVAEGNSATAPTDPTRSGYTFTGWDVDYSVITNDTTITAQYSINSFVVTFKDYDGTVLKTETVEHEKSATAPTDPTRSGFTFIGWDVDFSVITSDTTVTAHYYLTNNIVEAEDVAIQIYPNPTQGLLTIDLKKRKKAQLNIYSLSGKLILSDLLSQANETIELRNLSNGVYLLVIKTESSFFTKKLIVSQ